MKRALLDPSTWRASWSSASGFDRAGLVAVAVLGFWPLLTGGWRVTALVVACAGAFVVGRFRASSNAWIVPAFLVFGLAMVAATDLGALFSDSPVRGPLGYSNAKAALFAQGTVAAVMLAMMAGNVMIWRLALIAAVAFSIVPLLSGTMVAALTLVLVGASVVIPRRWARPAIAGMMALFLATLIATAAIGVAGEFPGASGDERRVTLWGEAVDLMADNPVLGAGNRGFSELSPTAISDADASWAHNEFLQLGAEHGLPVLAAAVFLILWLLMKLRRDAVISTLALPAAAAVSALSEHASFDYVGHFALVPMLCAALVGTAVGVADRKTTDSREGRPSRSTKIQQTKRKAPRPMGSSKPRVLIIIKGLGRGGAEQLLVSAAPYLDRERYDYHYAYVLAHKDALVGKLEAFGYPVHCLGDGTGPTWVARLGKLERSFDLVHVHSPVAAVAARLLRGRKTKLVCTEHNVWGRYHRATYWANRLTFGRNDHVFAVSDEVRRSIDVPGRRNGPTIETLYHGPDRAEIERWQGTDGVRAEFGIPTDAPLIGTVANFKDHKGYPYLLEAAAEVRRAVPDAHFMLVGQGPLEPTIKAQASALGLEGSITFTGFREDVPRLMGAFDLFTLASLHEGLSIALLEAMSLGKPPVVTGVGGHPEVVGADHGFVVPPGDAPALATKLVALLRDDELRRRLGQGAKERANQFDISETVKRTETVYKELLS